MHSKKDYNNLANKLVKIDNKFSEIEPVVKTINIWIRENDYELIPVMNILNSKIKELAKVLRD